MTLHHYKVYIFARLDKVVVTKEQLEYDFFEQKLGDADIYRKMIARTRSLSPDFKILLEEDQVLKDGKFAQVYKASSSITSNAFFRLILVTRN